MDDEETRIRWGRMDDGALEVRLSGRRIRLGGASRGDELAVFADAATWKVRVNHPEVAQELRPMKPSSRPPCTGG